MIRTRYPQTHHLPKNMTTTPVKKHSVDRRRGIVVSRTKRRALRRRGLRAFRCWQHLTRCYSNYRRRISDFAPIWFRRLRAALGVAALSLWLPTLAQAANFQVTSSSDISNAGDAVTTLREAIVLANASPGPDTIGFAGALSGETIVLTQGALMIGGDLSIDASGLAQAPVIDAGKNSRVMHFTAWEGNLSLTKLVLRNGESSGGGGGIRFASSGTLTLTDSTLDANSCTGYYGSGGAISSIYGDVALTNSAITGNASLRRGGGIFSYYGDVTLTDSIVSGNTTDGGQGSGGGIFTHLGNVTLVNSSVSENVIGGSGFGGGIATAWGDITLTQSSATGNSTNGDGGGIGSELGDITLTNSTVSENYAGDDGGGIYSAHAVSITNSTVSGNYAYSDGGGIQSNGAVAIQNSTVSGNFAYDDGGGIHSSDGAVTLTNSTVSGNGAYSDGGGIYTQYGTVTLTNTTAAWNTAGDGGGIFAQYSAAILSNSIIAGNSADDGPDLLAPEDPADDLEVSYSLIGNSSDARLAEAKVNQNNMIDVDPFLAPLADNGGPTPDSCPQPRQPGDRQRQCHRARSTGHAPRRQPLC